MDKQKKITKKEEVLEYLTEYRQIKKFQREFQQLYKKEDKENKK